MKVIKLKIVKETKEEFFILITFKKWTGKVYEKLCITSKREMGTFYADTGRTIDINLWHVVKSFLRSDIEELIIK